jgi:hypothetical protein
MKLATLRDGTPDGVLHVVSRDLSRATPATGIARTMQAAMDDWAAAEPRLRALAEALEAGSAPAIPFDPTGAAAPFPAPINGRMPVPM